MPLRFHLHLQAILDNPKDRTEISLLYANVSEKDILLKDKLDALAAKHPNFTVHYGRMTMRNETLEFALLLSRFDFAPSVLDVAPEDWKGSQGYIDENVIKKIMVCP